MLFAGHATLSRQGPFSLRSRKGDRLLLAFTYGKDGYEAQELDRGRGAANVLHYVHEGKDIVIGANRETNEIARYELTE